MKTISLFHNKWQFRSYSIENLKQYFPVKFNIWHSISIILNILLRNEPITKTLKSNEKMENIQIAQTDKEITKTMKDKTLVNREFFWNKVKQCKVCQFFSKHEVRNFALIT
jgi:type III secretory pathway component EscR